ncbi:DUF4340 domain-containing protein [Candidatus Dojkabacteria bacterium]|nr:DUF4340 domain-containing protein [Candidatus Dojkabacteria bacterium]
MKDKSIANLLLAIIISLGIIFSIVVIVQNKKDNTPKIDNPFEFENITKENVTKIEIITPEWVTQEQQAAGQTINEELDNNDSQNFNKITLENKDGVWTLDNQKANNSNISSFIEISNQATVQDIVSTNKDNHSKFWVDEDTGILVKYFDKNGDIIDSFYVGKTASTNSCYIRKDGDNRVYKVSKNLTYYATLGYDYWIDIPEENSIEDQSISEE